MLCVEQCSNYIIFSTERDKDQSWTCNAGGKKMRAQLRCWIEQVQYTPQLHALALLLFIVFSFFFSFEFRPHQEVAATDERSGCSFSLSRALLAVALASFKLLLPCLSCCFPVQYRFLSLCAPVFLRWLLLVNRADTHAVAVPPELTGFRLRVLCICELDSV